MHKKRKSKKKKRQILQPLSSVEEGPLNSLFENLNDVNLSNINKYIPSPEVARIVVENLPSNNPHTINLLFIIREAFEQKDVQKAIKKALFSLKRKGVSIPDREDHKESSLIIKKPKRDEPTAYVSSIDRAGDRGVMIMVPIIPKGVDVGIGLVNSVDGITYFIYNRYSKKRSREVKDFFFDQVGRAIETSLSHVATILEKAYSRNGLKTGESCEDYLKLRPWILENAPLLERPAVHDFIRPEEISGEILTASRIEKLFSHALMESWVIDPEKIQPVWDEISEVENSPIIVSDGQKENRISEIKETAISQIFPDSKRLILKDELEEMAYIFFKLDEEEYAHSCLAAASTMGERVSSLRINSFIVFLLERSLEYYIDITEKESKQERGGYNSAPTIITP